MEKWQELFIASVVGAVLGFIFTVSVLSGATTADGKHAADNVEYVLYTENVPYQGLFYDRTLRELTEMYLFYEENSGTHSGRLLLESMMTELCYGEAGKDFYTKPRVNDTSLQKWGECMVECNEGN